MNLGRVNAFFDRTVEPGLPTSIGSLDRYTASQLLGIVLGGLIVLVAGVNRHLSLRTMVVMGLVSLTSVMLVRRGLRRSRTYHDLGCDAGRGGACSQGG